MGATVAYMTALHCERNLSPVILSAAKNDTHIASKTVTALFYTLFIIATFTFVYKNNHILYNIMLEYNVLWHKSTIYLI